MFEHYILCFFIKKSRAKKIINSKRKLRTTFEKGKFLINLNINNSTSTSTSTSTGTSTSMNRHPIAPVYTILSQNIEQIELYRSS